MPRLRERRARDTHAALRFSPTGGPLYLKYAHERICFRRAPASMMPGLIWRRLVSIRFTGALDKMLRPRRPLTMIIGDYDSHKLAGRRAPDNMPDACAA